MSWVSDFIQNPVAAISDGINNSIGVGTTILDPLRLTPVYETSKKFASENVKPTLNVATGASLTAITGGLNLVGNDSRVQTALRDKKTSQLTFGASQDFADLSSGSGKMLSGSDASESEWAGTYRFGAKAGAVAAGAAYAGGYSGGTYLTGYGVGQNLQAGNIAGAVNLLPGGRVINEWLPGVLPDGRTPRAPSMPDFSINYPDYGGSPMPSGDGYPSISESASGFSPVIPIAVGMLLVGVYILKKRGVI